MIRSLQVAILLLARLLGRRLPRLLTRLLAGLPLAVGVCSRRLTGPLLARRNFAVPLGLTIELRIAVQA